MMNPISIAVYTYIALITLSVHGDNFQHGKFSFEEEFDDMTYILDLRADGSGSITELWYHAEIVGIRESEVSWVRSRDIIRIREDGESDVPVLSRRMVLRILDSDTLEWRASRKHKIAFKRKDANKSVEDNDHR